MVSKTPEQQMEEAVLAARTKPCPDEHLIGQQS